MNKSNKKFQAFKILKLSNLSKKLFALLTISVLSITTGACVDKNADNQDPAPTPAPTPVPTNQLDVLAIDKEKAFFVTPTGTKDKDCTTWKNACDLQTAIDKANKDATKKFVLVAQGSYFADPAKTDETKTFILKTGVKIYGGFDISVEELKRYAQASILEGKLSNTLNTKQILKGENLSAETILDGFIIQNALNKAYNASGAGLYLYSSNPKLTNLFFKNNTTLRLGGAIYNTSSSPSISNSAFISNFTGGENNQSSGGAIYNYNSSPNINNCEFIGNSTGHKNHQGLGGAIYNYNSSPNINNSVFNNNSSTYSAGAIENYRNSNPKINNSVFKNNSSNYGGAIYSLQSNPNISNSTFIDNSVSGSHSAGSAIHNSSSILNISNSVFISNSFSDISNSGAIYNSESNLNISNSILWNNKQTGTENIVNIFNYNTKSKPTIKNSILNKDSITGNNTSIDISATSNNQTPANFVIESDGKVIDADSKKLIKDKGDNALYKTTTGKDAINDKDLANNPRLNGASIDIGAYELQAVTKNSTVGVAEEKKAVFDIHLTSAGENKVNVIKVVREITGLGLKEAEELVDKAPSIIKEAVSKNEAETAKARLEEAGASVKLKKIEKPNGA